jgi:hypothetical protein
MATSDFLPLAVGVGANVETQAAYAAETSLLANGFQAGVAPSAKFNKALRQSTIMAAVLAQFIVDESGQNAQDDGTTATLIANLKAGVNAMVAAGAVSNSIQGAFKNLQASASGASANVSVSADEIVVESAANSYKTLRAVSLTLAGTSVGANGLDAGALAINTWYSLWVIWNGTTTAGLMSLSATAPTLPSGYTHKARVGWIRTDASGNKYPLSFVQFGRRVQYKVAAGSNVAALPQVIVGVQGNISTPTWASAALGAFIPTTAASFIGSIIGQGSGIVIAAPNNGYGAASSTTNPPPVSVNTASNAASENSLFEFVVESSSIYMASNFAGGMIAAFGWRDNL